MNYIIPKILVVDDEPDLELLVRQKFRREIKDGKYHFQFASNGIDAIEKLNEDKDIELVLTDINMPEMDGLTLLSKIKEMNNPLLHSVIVSAYGDIFNIRTAMNGGAFDFIVKPIDLADLEITIKKALSNLATFKTALESRDELITVRKELEEARALQLSMLPTILPNHKGLDIAVYMKTATEVGGDYYDFSIKENNSLNIVLGDATGHGMKAGIMVSIMKALFISDSSRLDFENFFNSSNKTIKSLNLGRMMMAFGMMNIDSNKVKFCNAGIPPFYLIRNNEIEELAIHGIPLGAMNNTEYKVEERELSVGDTILMMSDGFPELQNRNGEMFGYDQFKEELEKVKQKSSQEIINHFKDLGSNWVDDKDPDDDVTFVVIKVKKDL